MHIDELCSRRDLADAAGIDSETACDIVLTVSALEHALNQGGVTRSKPAPARQSARTAILPDWTTLRIIHMNLTWLDVDRAFEIRIDNQLR